MCHRNTERLGTLDAREVFMGHPVMWHSQAARWIFTALLIPSSTVGPRTPGTGSDNVRACAEDTSARNIFQYSRQARDCQLPACEKPGFWVPAIDYRNIHNFITVLCRWQSTTSLPLYDLNFFGPAPYRHNTAMRRIMTFRSTTGRINGGGPVRLWHYNII